MTWRIVSFLFLAWAIFLLVIPPHTWWLDLLCATVVALQVSVVASVHAER